MLQSEPRRVAIAGQVGDTENVLSLDVIPVLAPDFQLQWPWIDADDRSKIEKQYQGRSDSELPLEQVAASRPDVIIATSDTALKEHYEKLSQIAPVVAFEKQPASTQFDWQQSIRLIGTALNRTAEAEEQIASTRDLITQAKADHPEFAGTSISFAINYGAEYGITFYNGKGSPGETLFGELDFDPADHADKFTGERPQVGTEQLSLLDSDLLVVNFNGGAADRRKMETNRLFASIPAVRDKRYLGLLPEGDTSPLAWSLARPTPANLQWSINNLVPQLGPLASKVK
ncbi:ABC transporter substrate-binding protein [Microlunatus soli]|uniref:Iron complex transport system substrate-binding protein n=1 Tax=Microlunatus soli TaxID=630515 RepID=A0A1H1Z1F6_9ACTN|nr:ABC transporter substrate-binding protein [Microlunatus soli]SDT27016.1 iron complex transport system substrate-binding protein [Microlunatus soli]